jgi:hypothetical protein
LSPFATLYYLLQGLHQGILAMNDSAETTKVAPEALISKFHLSKLLKQGITPQTSTQTPQLGLNKLKDNTLQIKMAAASLSLVQLMTSKVS